jgi:hypothetical protein
MPTSLTVEQKLEAFKAEHPDAHKAIYDSGFSAGQIAGGDESLKLERSRIDALATYSSFSGRHEFILGQVRSGHDLGAAKGDFADLLATENKQLRAAQQTQDRRERLAGAAHEQGTGEFDGGKPPIAPQNQSARTMFETRVAEQTKTGKSKAAAINAVAQADPVLYRDYMAEVNAGK